jgi:hydrogenase maturation protein HypF
VAEAQNSEERLIRRARITIRGAVQGVGFRPFVHRLAAGLQLSGLVRNSPQGVVIEAEGPKPRLDEFLLRLEREPPPRAFIQGLECSFLDPQGATGFEILESLGSGPVTALVLPDIATCEQCLAEILDPADRRYRYPFTNCTNCGPRYTIIEALPYDRPRTTMASFGMCPACRREYEDPADRRFHAQPNACPACGPRLALWDSGGTRLAGDDGALAGAAECIRGGGIAAVKGLGGFQLMVDARSPEAVERLRSLKMREEKPFALMFPGPASVGQTCFVSPMEARLLGSPESPIVLLERRGEDGTIAAEAVAPGNPHLGVMLPYTPLHHLLLGDLGFPVVATSGNLSDEPICIDEHDALARLRGIADRFLVHDRPIRRHADDSVARVILGREQILRRARGYAPLPVTLKRGGPCLLAVGGQMKNTIALSVGDSVFLSPHIGDLDTAPSVEAFRSAANAMPDLFQARVEGCAADMHPDYFSTRYAAETGVPVIAVQHHHAHVLACMAENDLDGPVLGVSWDGTGFGPDGDIWGGEFLICRDGGFHRYASLRRFGLPGGEAAVREPRRSALGVLWELFGEALVQRSGLAPLASFREPDLRLLLDLLGKGVRTPQTTSAGRLFDAAASLAGLRQVLRYEGQAAMELEFILDGSVTDAYPFTIVEGASAAGRSGPWAPQMVVDWKPMMAGLVRDVEAHAAPGAVSARFHNALADAIVATALRSGVEKIVLTGGCFQNRRLTELAVTRLQQAGLRPYWHQRVPPNDGGIALGQAVAAATAWHGRERGGEPAAAGIAPGNRPLAVTTKRRR